MLYPEGSPAALTIASAAPVEDGPGWRLGFHEIRERNAAERLRDVYLEVVVDRGADLEPGSFYWHEVIGVEVRDSMGRVLGRVADVYRVGVAEVFVVKGGPVGEFDLPVVSAIVRVFAPERGEIVVDETVLDLDGEPVDAPAPKPRRRTKWSRHGKGGLPAADGPASVDGSGSGSGAEDEPPAPTVA